MDRRRKTAGEALHSWGIEFSLESGNSDSQLTIAFDEGFGHAFRRRKSGGTGSFGGPGCIVVGDVRSSQIGFEAANRLMGALQARRKVHDPGGQRINSIAIISGHILSFPR
jgi:hypothetical protein